MKKSLGANPVRFLKTAKKCEGERFASRANAGTCSGWLRNSCMYPMVKAMRSPVAAGLLLREGNRAIGAGKAGSRETALLVFLDRSIIQRVQPGSGTLQTQHKDTHSGFGVICCCREQSNAKSNFLSSLFLQKCNEVETKQKMARRNASGEPGQ